MKKPAATRGCRRLLVEMFQYLDGELSAARCRTLERHLASCEPCAQAADRIRDTISACRAANDRPLPAPVRRRAALRVKTLLRTGPGRGSG